MPRSVTIVLSSEDNVVVEMVPVDYWTFRVYEQLPNPIRAAIRAFVHMCRDDQRLVRRVILTLSPAARPGRSAGLAPALCRAAHPSSPPGANRLTAAVAQAA